jgi:uncharacterized protein (TIGR02996 family)
MTTQQALLQAVCDDPEADDVRLVYSDWLEETGDPEDLARAEFIRTQIELSRMPEQEESPETAERRVRLQFRERALLDEGGRWQTWARPLRPPEGTAVRIRRAPFAPGPFVRGFTNFALGEPEDFLQVGEALFDLNPVYGLFTGADDAPLDGETAARFLSAPWLRRVRRVWMTAAGQVAEQFFTSAALANLEEVSLWGGRFAAPGTAVAAPQLKRLRSLRLGGAFLCGPEVVIRLGELLPPIRLARLVFPLSGQDGGRAGMETLAHLDQFRNLESLALPLWSRESYSNGIRSLAASPLWQTLRSLRLLGEGFGDDEAQALAEAPPAPALRALSLSTHRMSSRGVAAIAGSPLLRTVTELDLGCGSGIGDEGATLLAASPHLGRLLSLSLPVARLGTKGVEAIAGAAWTAGLVRLDLRDNAIKKAGVVVLADPAHFPRLRRLELQRVVRTKDLKAKLTKRFGEGVRFVF